MVAGELANVQKLTAFQRHLLFEHDSLGFVERRENVVLLGPPGVGKSHLAISLAIAAAESGRRVYYGTLADLITSLEEAQAAGHAARRAGLPEAAPPDGRNIFTRRFRLAFGRR